MDGQSWLKMGAAEARNTITEEDVFVREDRTVMAREADCPSAPKPEGKKRNGWPGFWLALGTLLESFKWG